MKNYLTRLTFSATGSTVSFSSEKPKSSSVKTYNWSYRFNDGSCLVGTVKGQLASETHQLLNPTHICADYIDADGKTVLQSWKNLDFACFESNVTGDNTLIVASNDNFVGNSLCLVESLTRTRAQVTNERQQLIAEPFNPAEWTLNTQATDVSVPTWELDWQLLPLFPFLSIRFDCRLPISSEVYRWTFFPYFCPFPLMEVATKVSS